ncbi:MAG: TonB-dependent receptor, partial [Bacteroides sp.]|nr:TonB-dependent receptor [Bacteroides sp.]
NDRQPLPFVTVQIIQLPDSNFVTGTVTTEQGHFSIGKLGGGDYLLKTSFVGYEEQYTPFHIGRLSSFLDLGNILMAESSLSIEGVTVSGIREEVISSMDRKVYSIEDNLSQAGGSALQAMQNLPGVTIDRDGKVSLRGSDQVTVFIDGKQTAITGMGSQSGLENIPASAIAGIEIINNPSARYDASGMAGIINIIFRKEQQQGWNGRAGLTLGLGNLGSKKDNLPGIRDQYLLTPKVNPSLSANYRKDAFNFFVHGDLLYHKTMMKSEFFLREYDDSNPVSQQWLENRTQPIYNLRGGLDYSINERNTLTFSALFNYREYTDLGDLPYLNANTNEQVRLWEYYENEVNQTLFATITHAHRFIQPGHSLTSSLNYSFRRKDEVFYFDNFENGIMGTDTTALIADENILDLTVDYVRPLRAGRIEIGTKQMARIFPNDIVFTPGINSILDPGLAGTAEYREYMSAAYTNYVYELKALELEAGLRAEYARIDYLVDESHSVYESNGFDYFGFFPNVRASWLLNDRNRLTAFYNRRVDRPSESMLRVFPTYADPEILNLGNPTLVPQFTQSFELGYRNSYDKGTFYLAGYHRISRNILTKIITEVPESNRLASVNQNAGKGYNTGVEWVWTQQLLRTVKLSTNANVYLNRMAAFEIINAYPSNISFSREEQSAYAGNLKLIFDVKLPRSFNLQITGTYLSPDILPQGKILARYSVDGGLKKEVLNGRGELFLNASDIFNTLVVKYELEGNGFDITSQDYYETQVVRIGYQHRF